jgi:3-deoxy-D-manno-octulosonate 8-phosphate phosphatase (KDO 8-P phosphatase)
MNFKERLQKVKCFVFDIDGVLTDGQLHILQDGTMLRNMNIKDGYALRQAFLKNYPIFVISGSNAEGVKQRLKNLGIEEVYLNCKDKLDQLSLLLVKHHLTYEDVLYMGDDIPDLPILKLAGLAVCPQDACQEVKAVSHYITQAKGGNGAVREIIEIVMKSKKMWDFTPHR